MSDLPFVFCFYGMWINGRKRIVFLKSLIRKNIIICVMWNIVTITYLTKREYKEAL